MRAILVGHRGLIGSAISGAVPAGVELTLVDRDNYRVHRGSPADLLINAAGDPRKADADHDVLQNFRANVLETLAMLLDFRTERCIHLSTVSVYDEPADPERTTEESAIDPLHLSTYAFHKYLGEMIVRRNVPRSLVLRLGHVVGPGLRRNPVFDLLARGELYVHPSSRMPFIDARDLAQIIWKLALDRVEGVFNITGRGSVVLSDLASELGIDLPERSWRLARADINVDVTRVQRYVRLPDAADSVRRFCAEWRASIR